MSGKSPLLNTCLSNEQVHRLLALQAARDFLGSGSETDLVEITPLINNYFSFTFSIKVNTPDGQKDVYVKIPKLDLRGVEPTILPITPEDRQMAKDEEESLTSLKHQWDGDEEDVYWVKLCGTIPEYNALITERIVADDAIKLFRRYDTFRRFGCQRDANRLRDQMTRLGTTLGRFHQTDISATTFRLIDELPKFEFYAQKITSLTDNIWPGRIMKKIHSITDIEVGSYCVPTLKGLDIRNVLIDDQNRFYLLDPGKMKSLPREADLARFIATYRLLHWGRFILVLLRNPDLRAESAFLRAYCADGQPISTQILNLLLIKEQLKHWYNILDYLQRQKWPKSIKKLIIYLYVDPFFSHIMAMEWSNLNEWLDIG